LGLLGDPTRRAIFELLARRPSSVQELADRPTVEVEHRYFERLVDGEGVHGAIRSGGGWPALLDSYARMVKDQTSRDQTGTDQTGADPA